ncbi:hypothetical protein IAT38_001643 [Cryptococcus sp. DSM 104549]
MDNTGTLPEDHAGKRREWRTTCPTYDFDLVVKRSATEVGWEMDVRESSPAEPSTSPPPLPPTYSSRTPTHSSSLLALQNESLALAYLKQYTSVPVPNIVASFQDRGAFYLILEAIPDTIPALEAPPSAHDIILAQLQEYVAELHALQSTTCASFAGAPLFSPRLGFNLRTLQRAAYISDPHERYVLCHGNLGWENVLVDPETWEVKAIVGWENAGWYPPEVEGTYWRRAGPCHARASEGEVDDTDGVIDLLYTMAVERWKSHIRSTRLAAQFEPTFLASTSSLFATSASNLRGGAAGQGGRSSPWSARGVAGEAKTVRPTRMRLDSEEVLPRERVQSGMSSGRLSGSTTPLQQRLKRYDVSHPDNIPVTSQSLPAHVGLATRLALVEDFEAVAKDMEEDHEAVCDMVSGIRTNLAQPATELWTNTYERTRLHELNAHVPALCRTLSLALLSSHDTLLPLCNYLVEDSRLATRIKLLGISDEHIGGDRLAKDLLKLQTRKTQSVFGMREETNRVLGEFEGRKWRGLREFAENLLLLSHTAESLIALLPTRSITTHHHPYRPSPPAAPDNPAILAAQRRVESLVAGGKGHWRVDVVDILPPLHPTTPVPSNPSNSSGINGTTHHDKGDGRAQRVRHGSLFHRLAGLGKTAEEKVENRKAKKVGVLGYRASGEILRDEERGSVEKLVDGGDGGELLDRAKQTEPEKLKAREEAWEKKDPRDAGAGVDDLVMGRHRKAKDVLLLSSKNMRRRRKMSGGAM